MGEEEQPQPKRICNRTTPPSTRTQLELVDSDFALALALQEQERDFMMLPTAESDNDADPCDDEEEEEEEEDEEEEEEEEEGGSDEDYNYDEIFQSQEMEVESRFSEGEDSNGSQEFEEDDIDPDELSYEELLTLGDIVGEESRGLSAEEISSCLSRYVPPSADCKTIIDRCVICQVEYDDTDIDTLVALPCKHPYHSECIRNWLQIKKICPVCGAEVSSSNAAGTV